MLFLLNETAGYFQKQPFADALQNSCSWKFRKVDSKTPVLEPLFNKFAGLKSWNIKKKLQQEYIYHKHLPVTDSACQHRYFLVQVFETDWLS